MNTQLREGIDWVGHVDWTVRDFHGYRTERGSSYNAYLVQDEKTALIDTVKAPFASDLMARVTALVPLDKVDYLVCNHAEPDHSGSLPAMVAACPGAEVVCDEKCRQALMQHYDAQNWTFHVVADGDSLSLGKRTLTFLETPMVHWPESMFTYVPEEKLLFSMDAFGQHYAAPFLFDDEVALDVVMAEAKIYYANIVMLYGGPIGRVLDRAAKLPIEIVAPSHGVIWRKHIGTILDAYRRWVVCKPAAKVVVAYDTMWRSTERMAEAVVEGARRHDVAVQLHHVRESHITAVATDMLDAATVAFGSSTLNGTLMPQMAAVLTYLKGLRPKGKAGFSFGSYGWAKGGARDVQGYLEAMKCDLLREPIQVQFVPTQEDLDACREAGEQLAIKAIEMAGTE